MDLVRSLNHGKVLAHIFIQLNNVSVWLGEWRQKLWKVQVTLRAVVP